VDFNSKDKDGKRPLLRAAENGHEATVKLLLKSGKVGVDLRDNFRRMPLSRAAENEHKAVIKLLLKTSKINVNSKDN
jgi:ankyrin repeat protein